MTPVERAKRALRELVSDEPLAKRLHEALQCLQPLRAMKGLDTVVVEMLNDAHDQNLPLKEKAQAVADLIATILQLGDEALFQFSR
jgi:hypothetical protein